MIQAEIKFFWPLTEQILLDLDYEGCARPALTVPYNPGGITYALWDQSCSTVTTIQGNLVLDTESTVVKLKDEPNWIRRGLYSLMGIKWEKK
jgi:hypothetical protein